MANETSKHEPRVIDAACDVEQRPSPSLAEVLANFRARWEAYEQAENDLVAVKEANERDEQAGTPPNGDRLDDHRDQLREAGEWALGAAEKLINQLLPRCVTDEAALGNMRNALADFHRATEGDSNDVEHDAAVRLAAAAQSLLHQQ